MMDVLLAIIASIISVTVYRVWGAFCEQKGYSQLIKIIVSIIILVSPLLIYYGIPSTPSFTGNPYKDAQIIYERIYEDGESYYQVRDELFEYYIDKGHGMERAKEALNICSEM